MSKLDIRLAHLIRMGLRLVTADHVTDNGRITLDDERKPNGKQSGIGSFFQNKRKQRILVPTGDYVKSKAVKRKGGTIQIWRVTDEGVEWARRQEPPRTLRRVL